MYRYQRLMGEEIADKAWDQGRVSYMASMARKVCVKRAEAGDFSWAGDPRAEQWYKELAIESDPGIKNFYWFTLNWPTDRTSLWHKASLLDFKARVDRLLANRTFFGAKYAYRFEYNTEKGAHLHCHCLVQSAGKQHVTVKRHLTGQAVLKRLDLPTANCVHFGGADKQFIHSWENKIGYIRGEKHENKQRELDRDKVMFESIDFNQVYEFCPSITPGLVNGGASEGLPSSAPAENDFQFEN